MLKKVGPFGFSNASTGGHSARSMMFLELRILVRAMPLTATKDDFTQDHSRGERLGKAYPEQP